MDAGQQVHRREGRGRGLGAALLALGALGLVAAGCSSAARPTAIVAPADSAAFVQDHSPVYQSMTVGDVSGGEETTLISNSKISNEAFREALTTSMRLNGMLSEAPSDDFSVEAEILSVEQPTLQINFTTTAIVTYRVVATSSGAELYRQTVKTESEAKFTDSIVRQERIRIATEGAMKENIAAFMRVFGQSVKENPYPYFAS
ncbi:MAG: hypothetical protein AAGM38_01780 [Pseudomonadota bacterium]